MEPVEALRSARSRLRSGMEFTRIAMMMDSSGYRRKSILLVVLACAAGVAGCRQGPPMSQVRGKVQNKDGSLITRGVREIRFEPMADTHAELRKTAIGQIQDDGSFELFTYRPGDGVIHGKYAVVISVIKAPRDPVQLIEAEYTTSATTPYHVTVEDDIDNLLFEVEPISSGATRGAAAGTPATGASGYVDPWIVLGCRSGFPA